MSATTSRTLTGWGRVAPSHAFVTGPLEPGQLADLIKATPADGVLARGAGPSYGDAAQNTGGIVLHPVTGSRVDIDALVCGNRPALTATEPGILEILTRRSPRVADRRSIAQHVWDNEADAFGSNTIDVHVARLRSKLAGADVRIETVRGAGYRIVSMSELKGRRVAWTVFAPTGPPQGRGTSEEGRRRSEAAWARRAEPRKRAGGRAS